MEMVEILKEWFSYFPEVFYQQNGVLEVLGHGLEMCKEGVNNGMS